VDTLGRLGSALILSLPENTGNWLVSIVHPNGWAWFVCSVLAAIWICSRFIVRPLSERIAKQSENDAQALKFLRIAVDELRLELKSLATPATSEAPLVIAVNEQPAPSSTLPPVVSGTASLLSSDAKTRPSPSSTARRTFRTIR
jgi:hypothetical protein